MAAARERPGRKDRGRGVESSAVSALHPFLVTPEAAFGRPVCRLGLASYGQTAITPDDPPGFAVPRPRDWYRFVLQHPAVAVTLAAPKTRAELDEDLRVLEATGPLGDEEYATLAAHGEPSE